MKIKRMKASFGCLEQAVLELGPGLNLLEAPNESGKSTWASFIRLMLYGLDTRDRDKKNYLADKNRYQPWSGAPMEGEMLVEAQGQDIILRRFLVKNTPFGGFSLNARPFWARGAWSPPRRSWNGGSPPWCPPARRTCPTPRPRTSCGSGSTAGR